MSPYEERPITEPLDRQPRRRTGQPTPDQQGAEASLQEEFKRRQLALLLRCLLPVAGLLALKLGLQPERVNHWYAQHETEVLTCLSALITFVWGRVAVKHNVQKMGVAMWMNPLRQDETGERPISVADVQAMQREMQARRQGKRLPPSRF